MGSCLRFAISNLQYRCILGLGISNNNTCQSGQEPQSQFLHKEAECQCSEGLTQCHPVSYLGTRGQEPHLTVLAQDSASTPGTHGFGNCRSQNRASMII